MARATIARLARFKVKHMRLALWLHVFALAGLAGRVWLERRGPKPLPRVEAKW